MIPYPGAKHLASLDSFTDSAANLTGLPMTFTSLDDFLAKGRSALAKCPIAVIFVDDDVELSSTIAHHQKLGFASTLLFLPPQLADWGNADGGVHRIVHSTAQSETVPQVLTKLIASAPPSTWFYWGYSAEYLVYPFYESRNINELLAFHTEERRDAMLAYVVDLYASDLGRHPDGVNLGSPMFDSAGYYSLQRHDRDGKPLDRQIDVFGGLRWRFEEHIPWNRRRIDRISLFRAVPGTTMRADFTFSSEEMNTFACPWHHNITAAIASFRTAKALKSNPASKWAIPALTWSKSKEFDWSSRQLLDLGIIEPGQWF